MPISKYYRKFLKIIIIIQILNTLSITSCTLKDFKKNQSFNGINKKYQFKKLIIPRGINIPNKQEEYSIPYKDKDLKKENHNIFPPI